jgi:hypothetical protein
VSERELAYVSEVVVEQGEGKIRHALLPGEQRPVVFGTHGAVARHYGVEEGTYEPHASTLDYIVAAAVG